MRGNLDPAAFAIVGGDVDGVVVGIGSSSSGEGGGASRSRRRRDFGGSGNLNLAAFAVVGGDVADSRHLISCFMFVGLE